MTKEPPIVIEDREELIFMLSEAAALEHMIMCEYLFAAFSLKRDVSEGVTAAQLEAIKGWERVVSLVATQEMLHLALVSNLLTAVGSHPFLSHPNFPQRSKYYPPGVQLALLPFGEHALQHFLYLERPEGMDLEDAPEFAVLAILKPSLTLDDDQIVPQAQDFATIGHLYRGIEHGLRHLVEKYGEQRVFIGPPRAQATPEYFGWPELLAITDLASACQAIETIIQEGEGARGDWRQAHYGKFLQIMQAYRDLQQQDPGFEPARPVVAAYVRPPGDTNAVPLISDSVTAASPNCSTPATKSCCRCSPPSPSVQTSPASWRGRPSHGLRNELTGSERPSQNGLFEGKEPLFFQQGDLHDKYRRFVRPYPHVCRVGSLSASLVRRSRAAGHASEEARSAHKHL